MSILWTVKYKPRRLAEYVDSGEAVQQLVKRLLSWRKDKSKKAAFLYGPSGVGKTASVEAIVMENGFTLVEMNASDWRTKEALERIAAITSSQSTLYGVERRVIVLDELEGISESEERGGISAIISLVEETDNPLVLIADNAWSTQFASLREHCLLIQFKHVPVRSIAAHLGKICEKEVVKADDDALRLIAERAKGDLRSAVTDLQALAQGRRSLNYSDVEWLSARDRQEAIFDVLKLVFNARSFSDARRAADLADVDYEMLFEWIYENLPYQLTDKQDLYNGLEALAKADVYFRRIKAYQDWSLLKYALDIMTGGVATARDKSYPKWVPFKFPERIRMMARTRGERQRRLAIGMQLKEKCHMSAVGVTREYIPYLRIIFENDQRMALKIAEEFNFSEEDTDYLAGEKNRR